MKVLDLLPTMFGYRPILQEIKPPWMPPKSVLQQILEDLQKPKAGK